MNVQVIRQDQQSKNADENLRMIQVQRPLGQDAVWPHFCAPTSWQQLQAKLLQRFKAQVLWAAQILSLSD
jgi:hypothetical protein